MPSSTPSSSSGVNANKRSGTQSTSESDNSSAKRAKKPSDSTNSRRSAFHGVFEEINNRCILLVI